MELKIPRSTDQTNLFKESDTMESLVELEKLSILEERTRVDSRRESDET